MTPLDFALHAAAVALVVYGLADSRLFRPWRIRVYRWAYTRGGADLTDDTWASIRNNPADWDRFVHADDDPPALAVLAICHWCLGFYVSAVWTAVWALSADVDSMYTIATVALAVVPVEVLLLAVIARLSR